MAGLSKPYYEEPGVQIYCGDARELIRHAHGFDLIVTDPPYGISHSSSHGASWRNSVIENDSDSSARDIVLASVECSAFVFGSWKVQRPVKTRQVLIWDKGPASGMGDLSFPWKNSFEEIYVIGEGFRHERRDEGVLRGHVVVSWESKGRCHPNQKPVSLIKYLIVRFPATGVIDPFMGSGTTAVACKALGIPFVGIEIEERYCELAVNRLRQGVLDLHETALHRLILRSPSRPAPVPPVARCRRDRR